MANGQLTGGSALGGALLIAGTCIGAGMLALPLSSAGTGPLTTLSVNVFCWLFMLATGLLFMEATLWMPDGTNVLSMSERFLGRWGKWLGGMAFLYLYYCLMVAYIAEGSNLFRLSVKGITGVELSAVVGGGIFSLIFGGILYLGTRAIDRVNWLLMSGLILSFLLMIGVGSKEFDWSRFNGADGHLRAMAIPILFSALGYHNIVPTICTYLNRRVSALLWAIGVGTFIPLVIYTTWQMIVMGLIPSEKIMQALENGGSVSQLFQEASHTLWVSYFVMAFSLFAIVTSLLGVGMSIVDFLGDGLHIGKEQRVGMRRLGLVALVMGPPMVIAYNNPALFLRALEYAGGFGEAFLNGGLPVALVWVGRYRLGLRSEYALPGGKPVLLLLAAITLYVMVLTALS